MSGPNLERFVNAIASDLEEGGFREVTGTTLRRNLVTAVQAALPLLSAQDSGTSLPPVFAPARKGDARSFVIAAYRRDGKHSIADALQDGSYFPPYVQRAVNAVEAALATRQPVDAVPQGCGACDRTGIRQNDEGRNIFCPDCDLGRASAGHGPRQPVGEAIGEIVYSAEGGLQIEFYDGKPLAPMKLYAAPPAQAIVLDRYDAGLLSDVGGGDTAWWLDYLRTELGRAHDHYQHQVNPAKGAGHG